jgi:hypothetical protein
MPPRACARIDTASWVIPQLLQHGRVRRAHLGVIGSRVALHRRVVLAHELTHVVQQSGTAWRHPGPSHGEGLRAPSRTVRRFSDVDHHIIEEAALKKVFTQEQLAAIEEANTHRDYSQLPAVLNALLLGQKTRFGGYAKHEHFDNFVFDRANDRWVSQDEFEKIWDDHTGQWVERTIPLAAKPGKPRITPPQYIEGTSMELMRRSQIAPEWHSAILSG